MTSTMDFAGCAGTTLLASFLLLSVLLKVRDRRTVEQWFRERLSAKHGRALFRTITAGEAGLLLAVLVIGPRSWHFLVLTSGILALAGWLLRAAGGAGRAGCPCFGMASLNAGVRAEYIFLAIFAAELLLGVLPGPLRLAAPIWCAFGAGLTVGFYAFSRSLVLESFLGSRVANADQAGSAALVDHAGDGKPMALIFLSTRCGVCMAFLKYLEKFSEVFASWMQVRLVIDGVDVAEETLFGGSTILTTPYRQLADAFRVSESPTMIVWHRGTTQRYRGIQACNLALSELARMSLAAS